MPLAPLRTPFIEPPKSLRGAILSPTSVEQVVRHLVEVSDDLLCLRGWRGVTGSPSAGARAPAAAGGLPDQEIPGASLSAGGVERWSCSGAAKWPQAAGHKSHTHRGAQFLPCTLQ